MFIRRVCMKWDLPSGESESRMGWFMPTRAVVLSVFLAIAFAITLTALGYGRYLRLQRQFRTLQTKLSQRIAEQTRETGQLRAVIDRLPTRTRDTAQPVTAAQYAAGHGLVARQHIDLAASFAKGDWQLCLEQAQLLLNQPPRPLAPPTRRDVIAKAAWARFYLGRHDEALATLASAITEDPEATRLQHPRADMLLMLGRPQEARPVVEQLLEADPHAGVVFTLGNLHHAEGRTDLAIAAFRQVLAHGDRQQERAAAHNLALIYALDLHDHTRANAYLTMLLALAPESPAALAAAGRIMLLQDRLPEAENFLKRAHRMTPRSTEVMINLAILYDRQGQDELARAMRHKATLQDPHWSARLEGLPGRTAQDSLAVPRPEKTPSDQQQ